ncbi:hypothetical protein [Streptomyces sp. bgisy031]|uniref:hypothetical protein n=1 Tax=Streptomyces sp. bgisy031 TaxID=3413772 RepID=UPI003D705360
MEPDVCGIAATGHGPHDIARPPTPGFTEQDAVEVARLKADVMRLATIVTAHAYGGSLSGSDLVEARMGLINAAKAPAGRPAVVEAA